MLAVFFCVYKGGINLTHSKFQVIYMMSLKSYVIIPLDHATKSRIIFNSVCMLKSIFHTYMFNIHYFMCGISKKKNEKYVANLIYSQ